MARLILDNKQSSMEEVKLAVSHLERALVYPINLGEGKLAGTHDNNIHYFLGCAFERLGEMQKAEAHFKTATIGLSEPAGMMFYNDQPADMIMYQGLAHLKLGEIEIAKAKFMKLITYGKEHMGDHIKIDFFAVSLPDFLIFDEDLDKKNKVHCHYLIGLGNYGLSNLDTAKDAFDKAWDLDKSNCGVVIHKSYLG